MTTINELKNKVEPVQVDFWWGKTNPEETYAVLTDTFPYSHQKDNVNRGSDPRYNIPTTPIKTAIEFNALGTTKETNPIVNPSFEYDAVGSESPTGWSKFEGGGVSLTVKKIEVSNAWGASGTHSLLIAATHDATTNSAKIGAAAASVSVTPGEKRTYQCVVNITKAASNGVRLRTQYRDATEKVLSEGGSLYLHAGQTGIFTITATDTVPASATHVVIFVEIEGAVANSEWAAYLDAVITQEGEHASLTYFDGDALGYKWTGTPGNSISESTPPKVVTPTGVSILQYLWNFGDGTTGYGPQAKHTYLIAQPSVIASLIVQDSRGLFWARGHHIHLK